MSANDGCSRWSTDLGVHDDKWGFIILGKCSSETTRFWQKHLGLRSLRIGWGWRRTRVRHTNDQPLEKRYESFQQHMPANRTYQ